jgi:hypothetical protein
VPKTTYCLKAYSLYPSHCLLHQAQQRHWRILHTHTHTHTYTRACVLNLHWFLRWFIGGEEWAVHQWSICFWNPWCHNKLSRCHVVPSISSPLKYPTYILQRFHSPPVCTTGCFFYHCPWALQLSSWQSCHARCSKNKVNPVLLKILYFCK